MRLNTNPAGTSFTTEWPEYFPAYDVTVPAGYVCDLASVPRFLWWVWPPLGYYQRAALLHDWCYDCHHRAADICDRREADRRLREQSKRDGVGIVTRWCFWLAVRLCGGIYWNRQP